MSLKMYEELNDKIAGLSNDVVNLITLVKELNINVNLPEFPTSISCSRVKIPEDQDANEILRYHLEENYTAFKSTSNGNYFYNALSTSLYGNEEYAQAIKLVTIKYLVDNYEKLKPMQKLLPLSKSVSTTLLQCARKISVPNVLTIYCVAQALQIRINAIYPPHNGLFNETYLRMPVIFPVRDSNHEQKREVYILWTSTKKDHLEGYWEPNHFVPLIRKEEEDDSIPFAEEELLEMMQKNGFAH